MRIVQALLLAVAALSVSCVPELTDVLSLKQGQIQGLWSNTTKGRPMRTFYSIPYAQPPIGNLRFKDPLPASKWEGILGATTPSPMCPQFNFLLKLSKNIYNYMGQEDCLCLNVYTPKISSPGKLLPVMVYIHGGGFLLGSAIEHEGHDLVDEDVILVSINYRLGALGFASTGDERIPGNFGLKDQLLALRWVQENIESFGGDRNKVTIFGHSAGGSSVHFFVLSPQAKGLFKRAIMQSGNALCPFALASSHPEDIQKVAKDVTCLSPNGQIDIDCLQLRDPFEILKPLESMIISAVGPIHFGPRIDGVVIPGKPEELITARNYNDVDILIGFANDDGGFLTYGEFIFENYTDRLNYNRSATLSLQNESNHRELMKRVYDFYDGMDVNQNAKPEQVKEMISDRQFRLPTRRAAILHSNNQQSNVYYYKYSHKGDRTMGLVFPRYFGTDWIQHGDELALLFPMRHLGGYPLRSSYDSEMSEKLVKIWTNFAKTGNTSSSQQLGFEWSRLNEDMSARVMVLSLTPQLQNDELSKADAFWNSLCPKNSSSCRNQQTGHGEL